MITGPDTRGKPRYSIIDPVGKLLMEVIDMAPTRAAHQERPMTQTTISPMVDRDPVNIDIQCKDNLATCYFMQSGKQLLWVELDKATALRWADAFRMAADMLT